MKRLILLTVIILALFTAIGVGFSQVGNQKPPEKKYTVSLTLEGWNIAIMCAVSPDDVTPNQKKKLEADIRAQILPQLAADTVKPKK
jgi:hypothetical protein